MHKKKDYNLMNAWIYKLNEPSSDVRPMLKMVVVLNIEVGFYSLVMCCLYWSEKKVAWFVGIYRQIS